MLDIICTRKEKTRVILFFEIYKMMLIIFKSENCGYTGNPPFYDLTFLSIRGFLQYIVVNQNDCHHYSVYPFTIVDGLGF